MVNEQLMVGMIYRLGAVVFGLGAVVFGAKRSNHGTQ